MVSKLMAEDICLRLKLANVEKHRVEWLVEKHQYLCDAPNMRASRLKTILVHPGIGELLALHRADALASGRSVDHVEYCEELLSQWTAQDLNPQPLLTGDDLKQRGVPPGPLYSKLLDAIREAQLDGTIRIKAEAWAHLEHLLSGEHSPPG